MKPIILKLIFLGITLSLFHSCGVIVFRDVTCRDFKLTNHYYWFPAKKGDSVTFSNSNNNMMFKVVEKKIEHTTRYYSDTGCSCNDWSGIMLVNTSDTIWINSTNDYVFDEKDESHEKIMLNINRVKSTFNETMSTILPTFTIGNHEFLNVKKFTRTYTDSANIKNVYLAKHAGIIQFEMVNGETWINKSLSQDSIPNLIETFEYVEGSCE